MVLSNAERQRRFRDRRNRMAAVGVTADMIDRVAEIVWMQAAKEDPSLVPWSDILAAARTKKGREVWRRHIEDLGLFVPTEADAIELYGDEAELVRRVGLVLQATQKPPAERKSI